MANPVTEAGQFKKFTASTTIAVPGLKLLGIFVSQNTSATLAVNDGSDAVINTFTPMAGTFYPMPFECKTALLLVVSGTMDATAFYTV